MHPLVSYSQESQPAPTAFRFAYYKYIYAPRHKRFKTALLTQPPRSAPESSLQLTARGSRLEEVASSDKLDGSANVFTYADDDANQQSEADEQPSSERRASQVVLLAERGGLVESKV